jgi:hypothetical protein
VTNVPPSAAKSSAHHAISRAKKVSVRSFSTWPVCLLQYQPRLCFKHIGPHVMSMSRGRGSGGKGQVPTSNFPFGALTQNSTRSIHATETKKKFAVSEPRTCVCLHKGPRIRMWGGKEACAWVETMAWNPITRQSSGVAYETWNVRSLLRRRKMYERTGMLMSLQAYALS